MKTLKIFDIYVEHGLKIIPLLPFSKKPFFKNWQDVSLYDPATCRRFFEAREDYNMGLLLGDIVDVEGDSEDANRILDDLIGDIPHPRYRSSKSTHHLFLTPDPGLTRIVTGKIEFRGKLHQSTIPPSRHKDGIEYQWLTGRGFPIPTMPPKLLNLFHRINKTGTRKPDHAEFLCPSCGRKVGVHQKRLAMERQVCREMGVRWECNKCRTYDLRPYVRRKKR